MDSNLATTALTRGLKALIAAEPQITLYDTITGDGDCGFGLKRGADGMFQIPISFTSIFLPSNTSYHATTNFVSSYPQVHLR